MAPMRSCLRLCCLVLATVGLTAGEAKVPASRPWQVVRASLTGGTADEALQTCAATPDGLLLIGGSGTLTTPGVEPLALAGGGDGLLLRYDPVLDLVLAHVHLPGEVRSIAVDADGAVFVAAGQVLKLTQDCRTVTWTGAASGRRVCVDGGGGAWVFDGRSAVHLGADGATLGSVDAKSKDLAVDPVGKRLFFCGFNAGNSKKSGNPVHVPWIRATDWEGKPLWKMWDYTPTEVDTVGDMADSHPQRLFFGPDQKLYMFGDSDGGNTAYRHDPFKLGGDLKEQLAGTAFNEMWRAFTSTRCLFVCRIEPATGAIERGSFFYGMIRNEEKNRLEVGDSRAHDLWVDPDGRVYLTGVMNCTPPWTATAVHQEEAPRNQKGRWNHVISSDELYLAILEDDFRTLGFCSGFGQGTEGLHTCQGLGVAGAGGAAMVVGWAKTPEGEAAVPAARSVYLRRAFQDAYAGGKDGYLAVLLAHEVPTDPVDKVHFGCRRLDAETAAPLLATTVFGPALIDLSARDDARAKAVVALVVQIGEEGFAAATARRVEDPAGMLVTLKRIDAAWAGTDLGDRVAKVLADLEVDEAFQRHLAVCTKRDEFLLGQGALVAVKDASPTWLDKLYTQKNGVALKAMQRIAQQMLQQWPEAEETATVLATCGSSLIPVSPEDYNLLRQLTGVLTNVNRLTVPKGAKRDFKDQDFAKENARFLPAITAGVKALVNKSPEHAYTKEALRVADALGISIE